MVSHIILYADEFVYSIWEEYCEICGVSPSASQIKIVFNTDDVTATYDDDDEDEYDEE